MRGHVVLSLEQLARNSCNVLENVLCPAVIMSPEVFSANFMFHLYLLMYNTQSADVFSAKHISGTSVPKYFTMRYNVVFYCTSMQYYTVSVNAQ